MTEKKLFDLIEKTGETLSGGLHIIDTSDVLKADEDEGKFRVYHSKGYCFDVEKEYCCEPDEVNEYEGVDKDGYCYTFFAEWEGFDSLTLQKAYDLIKNSTH